jgi:hypothetical protein
VADVTQDEIAIAEDVVAMVAPDELPLLRQITARRRWHERLQGRSVGYGVDTAVTVVAPYVVLAVIWAKSVIGGEVRAVAEKRLRDLTRKLLHVEPSEIPVPVGPPPLDPAALVEAVVMYTDTLGGLTPEQSILLADALVGRLLRDGA